MIPELQIMIIYICSVGAIVIIAYSLTNIYIRMVIGSEQTTEVRSGDSLKAFLNPLGELFRTKAHKSEFIRTKIKEFNRMITTAGGFWGGLNGYEVLASKFMLPIMLFAFIFFIGILADIAVDITLLAAFFFASFSFLYPDSTLKAQAKKRQKLFMKQLPGGLDILKVAAEAGLDFHSSINYLVNIYIPGPLKNEMRIFQRELKLGISTVEALNNVAQRMNIPETSTIFISLGQSIEMGTSIVEMLEATTTDIRKKRLLSAETEAQKAVVKITFPLLLLILPGIFIILLAPIIKPMLTAFAGLQ